MNISPDAVSLQFCGSSGYRKHELTLTARQLKMIDKLEATGKEYLASEDPAYSDKKRFSARNYSRVRCSVPNPVLDKELKENFLKEQSKKKDDSISHFRRTLPVSSLKSQILHHIKDSQVLVLSGETGCGKTTQVPQFILDDAIQAGCGSSVRIVCTQPRRVAAIAVAERVAKERGEDLGSSVGYQVRLNSNLPRREASILYCTGGVLLQRIQSDPHLIQFSHIILDEVHERDVMTDITIVFLKQLLSKRPDVKVILMSATVNGVQFSQFYDDCPILHIPGFMHPVESFYLQDVLKIIDYKCLLDAGEDDHKGQEFLETLCAVSEENDANMEIFENYQINVIASLISVIHRSEEEGAILVFLPGWEDICRLSRHLDDYSLQDLHVLLLHGSMSQDDQKLIFKPMSTGIRKLVIATNIAESSLSIDDVVFVIDCGKAKMKMFDADKNLATLKPEWISKSNCTQRKGRAGRLRKGKVFKIFTREREDTMREYMIPEIVRTRLENVILRIKFLDFLDVTSFLQQLMDSPSPVAVKLALETLIDIKAVEHTGELTPMGEILANLPLDPQLGKMMILACTLSCLDPILTIIAALEYKSPFYITKGRDALNGMEKLSGETFSDHLTIANASSVWYCARMSRKNPGCENLAVEVCRDHCLSQAVLRNIENMKIQFALELHKLGVISSKDIMDASVNENSSSEAVVRAVITAGLLPNLVNLQIDDETCTLSNLSGQSVEFHPKSVNRDVFAQLNSKMKAPYIPRWFVYFEEMQTSRTFLVDSTSTSILNLLLFASELSVVPVESPHKDKSIDMSARERLEINEDTPVGEISEIRYSSGDRSIRILVCKTVYAEKIKFVKAVVDKALQGRALVVMKKGASGPGVHGFQKILSLIVRIINADWLKV